MTVRKALLMILVVTGLFALAGGAIGAILGLVVPDYYRRVFSAAGDPSFDPVQVSIGLGLTQGIGAGLVVGLVVILVVAWLESRQLKIEGERPTLEEPVPRPPAWRVWMMRVAVFFFALPFVGCVPYALVIDFLTAREAAGQAVDPERAGLSAVVAFVLSFVPASLLCFLIATILLAFLMRRSKPARWLFAFSLVCSALLTYVVVWIYLAQG